MCIVHVILGPRALEVVSSNGSGVEGEVMALAMQTFEDCISNTLARKLTRINLICSDYFAIRSVNLLDQLELEERQEVL